MIADNLTHILGLVTSIPELANSAGLAIGGKGNDPGLTKIPLPAAWIMYANDVVNEAPYGTGEDNTGTISNPQSMLLQVNILIYLPYVSQDDLLNIQFPLLEKLIATVHATSPVPYAMRWRYVGQKLALVYPDRIAYEQHYTLVAVTPPLSE